MFLPYAIGLVAAVAAWFSFRGAPILPLDDAYIHLVYARSLAESGVLRFNPSDPPSLGSSSPLWVAILAATHRLGVDLVTAALALDLVAFGVLVALTIDTARVAATALGFSPRRVTAVALLAGLVVATNGNLLWLALSGMETILFLVLSLAALRLYHRQGFSLATGAACGLVALTRLPGGLLAVLFLALDLLRRRSGWHRGVLTTALVVLPYLSWTLRVTGQLLPTPAAGKFATYAERGLQPVEILWFLRALVTYELWIPQTVALAALVALGLVVLFRERRRVDALSALLALWGLSHVALYAVTFRLVHQHGRYVAELHVILALLGSVALGLLGRRVAVVSAAAVLALAAWSLPSWHAVYAGNVGQMESVGLRMATHVRDTTPVESRVACFDIGALGWASSRYVIDLGGLVDPNLHSYLKERACAPYLRQKRATHLIDLRNVETDWMNGLLPAEREGARLLTLTRLRTFEIPPYDVPSVTNSVALDLYEVRSFRASPENVLSERAAPPAVRPVIERDAGHGLSLVAARFTPGLLTPLRYMGGRVELSLVWRAEEPLKEPLTLHVTGTLEGTGLVFASSARLMPALEPSRWPAGALLRETIRMPLSADTPDGEVTFQGFVSTEERASVRERTGERAVPLGSVVVRRSPFAPRDIYTLRTAAALRRQRRQLDVLAYFPER